MAEKKRITWKLNVFDICFLIVVLVAAGTFLFWKLSGGNLPFLSSEDGKPVTVKYVIELEQLHEDTANQVKVGHALYDRTQKQLLGTVMDCEVRAAKVLNKNMVDGTFLFSEVPERKNVVMEMEAKGVEYDDRIELESGMMVRAGTLVYVFGPGYYGTGYILSVEREGSWNEKNH